MNRRLYDYFILARASARLPNHLIVYSIFYDQMEIAMTLILGIDPGSIKTGYGIIKTEKNNLTHIAHGTITAKGNSMAERLHQIYCELSQIIALHKPNEAAIEEVFMQINIQSALKLGQARGAALIALAQYALPIAEYSPREIKKVATGYGAAAKEQI